MFEEQSSRVGDCVKRLEELRNCLNVDGIQSAIARVEGEMGVDGFWDDLEFAQKTVQKLKSLKSVVTMPEALRRELEDAGVLIQMAVEAADESMGAEIAQVIDTAEQKLHRLEMASLFSDPRDSKNAILNIHPGAGGTESCDWAEILYRMILRYCERMEYTVEILDYLEGDEAGIKSVSLLVSGANAYGNLKSESGVHRLVRISPFDANKRRHTSFAAIEVLVEVDDDIEIEVSEDEVKMDVFRSSGAGGQKVNKTSSAVRLTHLPTGIVVACQIERSQHRNRATAMNMLKSKLYDIEMQKLAALQEARRDGQSDVAWGSQIRSYVLHPYQMIKDHRTGVETGSVDRVLDGDLEMFVEGYLKWRLGRSRPSDPGMN